MPDLDLFAGAGGWDVAARKLGRNPLGIECDASACLTRDAAGHATLNADIAALDPSGFAPCDLLIASPPCQSYSRAGKGEGRKDVQHVVECSRELARGEDTRATHLERCADARSLLVVEPLRWALALMPRVAVCEQVPDVLPYWRLVGELLTEHGYSWWAGVLEAERYGVPQTRERAILIARRDGIPAHPPEPTHRRYVKGEANSHEDSLFGDGLLPWVSMAQALGWTKRAQRRDSRPGAERQPREMEAPSYTIRSAGSGSAPSGVEWVAPAMRANGQTNACVRAADEPAPTIFSGHDTANRKWMPTHYDRRQQHNGDAVRPIPVDEPAPTIASSGLGGRDVWTDSPKSTLWKPDSANAVRVSVQEAAILQTFDPDYPWQGSRTAQFQQIGNAVPPMLAEAILRTVV